MSSELSPKMKILLFLREADEQMTFDYFLLATSHEGGDEFTRETDVIDKLLIRDWFQS